MSLKVVLFCFVLSIVYKKRLKLTWANFSVDARASDHLREARLKAGASLEARSRLDLKQRLNIDKSAASSETPQAELFDSPNVANLIFWSVGLEDSGKYTCSVDFKRARSRHQAWQVQVLGKFLTQLSICKSLKCFVVGN